jgi:phospholipid/cholesterol/gamma-HCH transport system permease protein
VSASLTTEQGASGVVLRFAGRLDLASVGDIWDGALRDAGAAAGRNAVVDVSGVPGCDTAGATLLAAVSDAAGGAQLRGANGEIDALLAWVRQARSVPATAAVGKQTDFIAAGLKAFADALAFTGEVVVAALRAPSRRRMIPVRDVLSLTDGAGLKAIPLIVLLGFLMGLILAFQSSIPLRRFGAEIYVVNLVTISLFRELGPLLAAVVLAGRTGSAFAAELGTMVVNDEVAAIATMGIDPVTMLVLPRLIAAMLVMPGLALLMEISGLFGMTLVMGVLGFPAVAVFNQAVQATAMRDLIGGLVKASVFGAAVAVIGCRTGLGAGLGPRAVGQAATAAVVGGIFATILLDGIFTVLFFRLGL